MGPVRDDEHNSPIYNRTKSAARLFNELIERVTTNSPGSSHDKAKSSQASPLTGEAALPPNPTLSLPPMEAPNLAHATSKSQYTSNNLSQRVFEHLQSHYNLHHPHEPSPTDSHPRNHPRSHSRRRNSRSSETISAMLLIATERLAQETSKANEAERQSSEILSRFKIAHHAKHRLEVDLQRAKDELELYKTQLNIAQAEIRRAQEVVDKVDRQRADAEDEARRGREKIRKLTEARSIELAMEEGRRLGYEEGMRQGRLMMQARNNELNQPTRYYRRTSYRSTRDDDDDQVSYFSYTHQEERQSTESFRSPTSPSTPTRSSSRRRRTSDASHAAHPTSHKQVPSSTSQPNEKANHPENIAVRPHPTEDTDPNMPIRPISFRNRTPSVSHRSFKVPPDGYIPPIGANSVISLPPPHELSKPVPPAGAPQPSATATSSSVKSDGKRPFAFQSSEQTDQGTRKQTPKPVDGESISRYSLSRLSHTNNRHKQPTYTRPMSGASGASTSSLLGPPPDPDHIGRKVNIENYFTEGARRTGSLSRASTQSEKNASNRRINPETILPSSPPPQSSFLDNKSATKMQENFIIERPKSTDPTQRPQSRSSRRPREIVLPTPLIGTLLNPSNVQKPNEAAVRQWRNDGPLSPDSHNTRPHFIHSSVSNTSVPGIEIVTPSSHTSSPPSEKTVIDPVLLTPESARSTPLPQSTSEAPSLGLYFNQSSSRPLSGDDQRITMVLPDNKFPPGFVPLSPIPGMKNLDSYPSGFAPSTSQLQDEYPGGQLPLNFSYPSSPLIK